MKPEAALMDENAFRLRNRLAAACEDHAAGRLTDAQFLGYATRTCRGFDGCTTGNDGSDAGLFDLVVLDVLRDRLEAWLASNGLKMVPIPQSDPHAIPVFTTTPTDAALAADVLTSRFDEGGDPR